MKKKIIEAGINLAINYVIFKTFSNSSCILKQQ